MDKVTLVEEVIACAQKCQPFALMLCGAPASGKSTFRQDFLNDWKWVDGFLALKESLFKPVVVISTDDYIEQRAKEMGVTYSDAFDTIMPSAQVYAKEAFKKALDEGKNLILDQTHCTVSSRRKKLGLLPKSYAKLAVAFEVEREAHFQRFHKRERDMPLYVLESMLTSYIRPTKAEGFTDVFVSASEN